MSIRTRGENGPNGLVGRDVMLAERREMVVRGPMTTIVDEWANIPQMTLID